MDCCVGLGSADVPNDHALPSQCSMRVWSVEEFVEPPTAQQPCESGQVIALRNAYCATTAGEDATCHEEPSHFSRTSFSAEPSPSSLSPIAQHSAGPVQPTPLSVSETPGPVTGSGAATICHEAPSHCRIRVCVTYDP